MATVYILHSLTINQYYIGSCLDLTQRLAEHLSKKNSAAFTKRADDWKVFLTIENLEYAHARKLERHIKKMKSRKYLENLLLFPEMIERIRNSTL